LAPLIAFLARRSVRTATRRPATLGFFLLAAVWCLLFFSLSGSKRPGYILPALPPLALALGCYLDVILPRERLRSLGSMLVRHRSPPAHQALQVILILGRGASVAGILAGLVGAGPGCLPT